mmetsp:Transcript_36128/g.108004  ORF Transcript_36128/g.108004 Transcript_36128/m.108004 type:complete len:263 (-) Transcript_36128:104-892(-)
MCALQAQLCTWLVRPSVPQRGCQPAHATVGRPTVELGGHVVHDDHYKVVLRAEVTECSSDVGEHPRSLRDVVRIFMPETEGDGVDHQHPDIRMGLEEGTELLHRCVELRCVVRAADVHAAKDCLQVGLPCRPAFCKQCPADLGVPAGVERALRVDVDRLGQGRGSKRYLRCGTQLHAELGLPSAGQAAQLQNGPARAQRVPQQPVQAIAGQGDRRPRLDLLQEVQGGVGRCPSAGHLPAAGVQRSLGLPLGVGDVELGQRLL